METFDILCLLFALLSGAFLASLPDPLAKERPIMVPCMLGMALGGLILLLAVCTLDVHYPVVVLLSLGALTVGWMTVWLPIHHVLGTKDRSNSRFHSASV